VNDILIIDDYAHHPTELKATLETAKTYNRRIIAIFQPHLFSRTQTFYKEFAECLTLTEHTIVTDIFPAREKPIEGITSEMIVAEAQKMGMTNIAAVGVKENAISKALEIVKAGDILITIGAGSITQISQALVDGIRGNTEK